jgi:hypothetical protein
MDVAFDEEFNSPLAATELLFHDAVPTRAAVGVTTGDVLAHTGPPDVFLDTAKQDLPWVPYTAMGTTVFPTDDDYNYPDDRVDVFYNHNKPMDLIDTTKFPLDIVSHEEVDDIFDDIDVDYDTDAEERTEEFILNQELESFNDLRRHYGYGHQYASREDFERNQQIDENAMFQSSYNDKATMKPEVYKLPVHYDLTTTNHPSHLFTKSVEDPDKDHEHQYFADVASDYGQSRYGPPYQEIQSAFLSNFLTIGVLIYQPNLPTIVADHFCSRKLPFSGKRLYEEQERFMKEQGFRQSSLLGLWYKQLPDNGIFLILLFADDQLMACTDASVLHEYMLAMKQLYQTEWHTSADWLLNARINRLANGDITLDQSRYSKAIVQQYIPNAEHDQLFITAADRIKYMNPIPASFVFTKYDCSYELNDVRILEEQFGFRYIEVVGSLIFLANTAVRQLFAIRKLCRFMHLPGHNHFAAALHILHHLRCYPARPLIYYHDVHTSPVAAIIRNIADKASMEIEPTLVYFTDSAFGDSDEGKSTGCYFGFLQGGIVDMASSVPNLTANSAAEAECSYASVASLATLQFKRTFMEIDADNVDASYTVPLFTDSQSTIDIARNDRGTAHTRHTARRQLIVRTMFKSGNVLLIWCDGETQQISDVGTKARIAQAIANFKFSICEAPVPHEALNVSLLHNDGNINRRGVLELSSCLSMASMTDDLTGTDPDDDEDLFTERVGTTRAVTNMNDTDCLDNTSRTSSPP